MNCREGDLAVVVLGPPASNIGRVIRVLRVQHVAGFAYWEFEGHLEANGGGFAVRAADRALRPIRDTDGTDEILALIGKPVGDEVAA